MVISQTPLRISICGGGTDFKGYYEQFEGNVLSSAIDKYIFVIVKERFDDLIYVNYTKKEIVKHVEEIKHDLVRESAKMSGIKKGFEITMLADIPSEGSGLGSSSSLTVGLLHAFYAYQGIQVTQERLAKEACEIEIDILQSPIGKQDQYIAAYGGLKFITFKKDDSVLIEDIDINGQHKRKLGANLILIFTNVTRQANDILKNQKSSIDLNIDFHHKIKKLAQEAHSALLSGDIDHIGELLKLNWEYKKNLSNGITNPAIDEMYEMAVNAGAIGGKVAGAGGGGFLLVYCKRENHDNLRESLNSFKEMPFLLEPHGSKIIFNYTRYDWK